MGQCGSKSKKAVVVPDTSPKVEFRLRKTFDGRRLESEMSLDQYADSPPFTPRGTPIKSANDDRAGDLAQTGATDTRSSDAGKTVSDGKRKKTKKKTKKKKGKKIFGRSNTSEDEGLSVTDEADNEFSPQKRALKVAANSSDVSSVPAGKSATLREDSLSDLRKSQTVKPNRPAEVKLSAAKQRYKAEPVLEPNVLPVNNGPKWTAPSDVKREDKVRAPKKYTVGEHMKADHTNRERSVLTKADYSTYVPGTGPVFNGPLPGFIGEPAKYLGVLLGHLCLTAIILLSFVPNMLFFNRLQADKVVYKWICTGMIWACNVLNVYTVYFFSMELKRFFWRATLKNTMAVSLILGAIGFAWQTIVIYSVAWLNKNRGVFSFLMAVGAGIWTVHRHETNLERRKALETVFAAFLEIEKNSNRMTELMGAPAVRTNEMQYLNAAPIWARYRPDELCEWLNAFFSRIWSFYNKAVAEALRESIEPLLEASRPSILKRMSFKTLDFGASPFEFRTVTFVGKRSDDMAVSIDFDFAWSGKSEIVLAAKTHLNSDMNISVKDLEIYAKLRISMHPLVPLPSPLGGVVISLTEKPVIEFNVELPSGLDMMSTAIEKWLTEFLADLIGDMLIQPERIVVPLSLNFAPVVMPDGEVKPFKWYYSNILQLHNTGVLRVTVIRAENVPSTDTFSKTDPYIKMHVKKSGVSIRTTTKDNDEDPVWNETFYIPVDDATLRTLKIAMFDSDGELGSDDKLGNIEVKISEIIKEPEGKKEMWLSFPEQVLGNKPKPPMRLLLDTQFIMFGSAAAKELFPGMGLLTVTILRGVNLMVMDSNGLSDPFVKVKMPMDGIGKQISRKESKGSKKDAEFLEFNSKCHKKTLNPTFNETFEFSPADEKSKVIIEIYDVDGSFPVGKSSNFMGNVEVPISVVIEQGGSMEARFKVSNADSGELDMILHWQSYA